MHVQDCVQGSPHIVRGRGNHNVGQFLYGFSVLYLNDLGDVAHNDDSTCLLVKLD